MAGGAKRNSKAAWAVSVEWPCNWSQNHRSNFFSLEEKVREVGREGWELSPQHFGECFLYSWSKVAWGDGKSMVQNLHSSTICALTHGFYIQTSGHPRMGPPSCDKHVGSERTNVGVVFQASRATQLQLAWDLSLISIAALCVCLGSAVGFPAFPAEGSTKGQNGMLTKLTPALYYAPNQKFSFLFWFSSQECPATFFCCQIIASECYNNTCQRQSYPELEYSF